ncbi:hypothetical protein DXT88_19410 [Herbaspirillum lusitanum]|uniref:TIR domain-containing protein n=1 Tax=Herbaspirillum lusitanum TaxID=213312 RepID=UPI0022373951|nr:TIR domain-containing protein [Herbaspirillum lusitanum]MCW5300345.1 hypothetical protein [Herbaspirillum lusitanum]
MSRRVFFSFHYQQDIWRVSQVRNSGVTQRQVTGKKFLDHADWERVQRQGASSIKQWINTQLKGSSVTVVLIGSETASREWVTYEIEQSQILGKGLLGIRIHQIKGKDGKTSRRGENPFSRVKVINEPKSFLSFLFPTYLSAQVPIYDWVDDDGYSNFGAWVDTAAKKAGY